MLRIQNYYQMSHCKNGMDVLYFFFPVSLSFLLSTVWKAVSVCHLDSMRGKCVGKEARRTSSLEMMMTVMILVGCINDLMLKIRK